MKYKRPEMGYAKVGILHNSRVYVKETIVFWKRKGKEIPHCRLPKDSYIVVRKGESRVRRWGFYMMFQGYRKPIKRYLPYSHWNPTKAELDQAVESCTKHLKERSVTGDLGTWVEVI